MSREVSPDAQPRVLISLLLTIGAATCLLLHMPTVSLLARLAQEADGADPSVGWEVTCSTPASAC